MYKVVLWGIGDGYNFFISSRGYEKINVVGVTDSEGMYYRSFDGIPLVSKDEVCKKFIDYDYLIISVFDAQIYNEIVTEAVSKGVDREIILPVRIFQIPFFDFDDYIKIKRSNISIISDYCFAGFLYHRFGMKFTSPTINMYSDNENYIKFLSDIEGYIHLPMEKVENIVDDAYLGTYAFPRGRIGDVEWFFIHDSSFDTACARWKRGVERVNLQNYIVIMTIRSDEMAARFDELPIKYKIGFYWKDLGLESVVCLPQWRSEKIRAEFGYNFSGLVNRVAAGGMGGCAIDWMRALQHKDNYIRVY